MPLTACQRNRVSTPMFSPVSLSGNQVALLHQRGQRSRDDDHAGHGKANEQVGTNEELAVVEVVTAMPPRVPTLITARNNDPQR